MTDLLALVNSITAPIIQENQNAAANAALLEVMPEGKNFEAVDLSAYELPATVTQAHKEEGGGFVIQLTTTGYGNHFVIICGVRADGTVSGAKCLSSTETVGKEKTYGENFTDKNAEHAFVRLSDLRGCEAHSTVMLSSVDEDVYRRLGINLTCEPKYQTNKLFHR